MMTRVLMLHRVLPNQPTAFGRPSCYRLRGTALAPAEFLQLLDAGPFRPLDEVVEAVRLGEEPPPGLVLTFDDGYREWIEHIAPLLEAHAVSATFFASPAFTQNKHADAHPVDVFYWLLDHARRPHIELRLPNNSMARGTLESDKGKTALVTGDLKRHIVNGPRIEVRETLRLLADALRIELPPDLAQTLYPSEPELQALTSAGHRLGGHGMSHRHLTSMGALESSADISDSLAWIARLSGAHQVPFAYPDGAFDLETERLVERAGASCALTCVPGSVNREVGLFQMPREFVTASHPLTTPRPEIHS